MRTAMLCVAGVAAVLVADFSTDNSAGLIGSVLQPAAVDQSVDRTRKGGRLPVAAGTTREQQRIAAVEVVGLEQAAVIYRDRQGRVLFRTDPVENATVIVRGVALPAVTIRDTSGTAVSPVILPNSEPQPARMPAPAAGKPKLPDGCESAVSLLTGPGAARIPGRCIAAAPQTVKLAGLQ